MRNQFLKILVVISTLFLSPALAKASFFDQQAGAFWVHYKSPSTTISTAAVVVDLTDTVNWPHKNSGSAKIQAWRIEVDGVAAGTSTIKLGVVTQINASSGTVNWFYTKNLTLNVSGTTKLDSFVLSPAEINAKVTASSTTYFIGSENTIASSSDAAMFQNDVSLPSARGNTVFVLPAIGDIVLEVVGGGANAVIATIDLLYSVIP